MSLNATDVSSLSESLAPLDDADEFILVDKSIKRNELGQLLNDGLPVKVTVKKIKEYLTPATIPGQNGLDGAPGQKG